LKVKAGLGMEHFSRSFSALRFRSIEVKGTMERPSAHVPDTRAQNTATLAWTAYVGPAGRSG